MSIHVIHHETRWQPGEYFSDNEVKCLNCSDTFDANADATLLKDMGVDKDGQHVYLCFECWPGFTCDWCQITTLEPLNRDLDGLCAGCLIKLLLATLEAGGRAA